MRKTFPFKKCDCCLEGLSTLVKVSQEVNARTGHVTESSDYYTSDKRHKDALGLTWGGDGVGGINCKSFL